MMKYSLVLSAFLQILSAPRLALATCLGSCDVEVQGNASCLPAFGAALQGDLASAAGLLKYGRYCGDSNECDAVSVLEDPNDTCLEGSDNCPPDACDPVDLTCFVHGTCLDDIRAENSSAVDIFPDRCFCDTQLVAENANIVSQANGTALGGCDEAFYSIGIPAIGNLTPIQAIQHEGTMMSAFFCCNVRRQPCSLHATENNYTELYTVATTFCASLLDRLQAGLGLDLCGDGGDDEDDGGEVTGENPVCYVCGSADKVVTLPNAPFPLAGGRSCAQVQAAGLDGNITETNCGYILGSVTAVVNACGCEGSSKPDTTTANPGSPTTTASPMTAGTDAPTSSNWVMTTSLMTLLVMAVAALSVAF